MQAVKQSPKEQKSKSFRTLAIVFLCIGAFLVVLGQITHLTGDRKTYLSQVCTASTAGKIGDITRDSSYDGDGGMRTTYIYQVFYTVNGNEYRLRGEAADKPQEGAAAKVHYNPDKPSEAYFGNKLAAGSSAGAGYHTAAMILSIIGIVMIAAAGMLILYSMKVKKS